MRREVREDRDTERERMKEGREGERMGERRSEEILTSTPRTPKPH